MMKYFSSKKKWLAYLVLLTFVFTCIVPTNIVGGNSEAWADIGDGKFTVQYWANLTDFATSGDNEIKLINTSKENGIGRTPKNSDGTNIATKSIFVDEKGNVQTRNILTPIFTDHDFKYAEAPFLHHFDIVTPDDGTKGNYDLIELWVRYDNDTAANASDDGWEKYSNPTALSFTNNEANCDDNVVLINDSTVIRLVYNTTVDTEEPRSVDIYDYDISDGTQTDKGYWNVEKRGINSDGNYGDTDKAKLAFGNGNTGTGLQLQKFVDSDGKNNLMNQYNRKSVTFDKTNTFKGYTVSYGGTNTYGGCTFGLVTGVDANGNIQYKSNIVAPKLFNEDGSVIGKNTLSGWELNFNRSGDTFTLSDVLNSSETPVESNLNSFEYIAGAWTNNFWPLDQVTTGTDPIFGSSNENRDQFGPQAQVKSNGQYLDQLTLIDANWDWPASDDGVAHNSYFGMHYTVDFDLTANYIGPLNYYFFGDDDMWVILEYPNGTSKVVCDIGGVHSSVGQYVDLWDYIGKGDSGEYALHFFYTERGASGSSCYMQFTLPFVNRDPVAVENGFLKIGKTVDTNQVIDSEIEKDAKTRNFEFTVDLSTGDKYPYYKVFNSQGIEQGGGTINAEITSGDKITLKHGEYAMIYDLPFGTSYTVTETPVTGYSTKVNNVAGVNVTGTIQRPEAGAIEAPVAEALFTNILETTEVSVNKVWEDDDNRDRKRPESISVELQANGQEYKFAEKLVLNEQNSWSGKWSNLPKYDTAGNAIAYTVKELNVPEGYSTVTTGTAYAFEITNSYTPETTNVQGTKFWKHGINPEENWPEGITVNLFADGEKVASQIVTGSSWTFLFKDLPKYKDGTEIKYSVTEELVEGYQPVYDTEDFDITNIFEKQEASFINVSVTKSWMDNDNAAKQRPESITVQLLRDGEVTTSQAITADMGWAYDFGKLPKYDISSGKPYNYTVREVNVPEGYIPMIAGSVDTGFIITNTLHNGEIGQFTVEKNVTGTGTPPADEKFGFRLSMKATEILWNEALEDELEKLEDNHTAAKTKRDTLVAELDNMTADFKVYTTASAYQLVTVKSISSSPSVYQYTMLDKAGRMEVATSSAMDFWGNTPAHDKSKDVIGEIIKAIRGLATDFSSMSNRASVFLRALGDEVTELLNAFGAAVEINETDVNRILDKQNQLFDAQVQVEATSDAVYQFEQKASTPSAVTLIVKNVNSGAIETIEMDLKDLSDTEYYRPDGTLLKDGKFYLADGEKYSFIAIAADGVKIEYIVVEDKYETENYIGTDVKLNGNVVTYTTPNPSVTGTTGNAATDELVFVNKYEDKGNDNPPPGKTTISRTVEKVWNDNNNPDRPTSITVQLLRNGEVVETVTLSAANGWSYNWPELDAGYTWSVKEANVAEGYTASVAKSGTTFIITNTYSTPEENIPDENVPTGSVEPGEPLDELEDPEIPLGDAPATGDTNNAAPFMALMLAAIAGLVITRRKFN